MKDKEDQLDKSWLLLKMSSLNESVALMKQRDRNRVSDNEGCKPSKLCWSISLWAQRPRYLGAKNVNVHDGDETWLTDEALWYRLQSSYVEPGASPRVTRGSRWPLAAGWSCHPNLVRYTPWEKETFMPAGIDGCTAHGIRRFEQDAWASSTVPLQRQ